MDLLRLDVMVGPVTTSFARFLSLAGEWRDPVKERRRLPAFVFATLSIVADHLGTATMVCPGE